MYTFIQLLKKIREESGLTQEQLAKVLGVSTILISMIEGGQKGASKSFVLRLANKLDVKPNSITPFIMIDEEMEANKLNGIEKSLVQLGEKLQVYLIKKKSKNLKQYVH